LAGRQARPLINIHDEDPVEVVLKETNALARTLVIESSGGQGRGQ
jgi:hypothetical protein